MDNYKIIIRDYFYDFYRNADSYRTDVLVFVIIGLCCPGIVETNWVTAVPVMFAFASACIHKQGMADMMYLVPASHEERERYLQKMLYVKIGIPLFLALIVDFLYSVIFSMQLYAFIIQVVYIVELTMIMGILCSGNIFGSSKAKYGAIDIMNTFCIVPLLGVGAILKICSGHITKIEFWAVVLLILILNLPGNVYALKKWKTIRFQFADYEFVSGVRK